MTAQSKFLTLSLALLLASPALALEKIGTTESINKAITHAARHREAGLAAVLDTNWQEGENGALLNVYTPFMMVATKAAKLQLPAEPQVEDFQSARKNMGRLISQLQDPKMTQEVKFALSFYGEKPDFASHYRARIQGYGRGAEVNLKPVRQIIDKVADPVPNARDNPYMAINSYYFDFNELAPLEEIQFIVESPSGESHVFRLNAKSLY